MCCSLFAQAKAGLAARPSPVTAAPCHQDARLHVITRSLLRQIRRLLLCSCFQAPSARRIPLPAGIPRKGRPLKHDALRYESVVYRTSVAPSNSFRPFWQLLSAARRAASAIRFSEPGQSQPASDNATCGARFTAPFSRLRSPDVQANRLSTQPVRLPASSGHKSAGYPITPDPSNPHPVDLHQLPAHLPATCCTALLFKVLPQTI